MVTRTSRRERIEQLALILDGDLAATDARRDVRRLATLAGTVTERIAPPQLDDDTRDRIRTRVLAEVHTDLHAAADLRTGTARPRRGRVAIATGVASVLVGTSGVAVAAQEALPGDALYSVKQATESFRVAAASDLTEQGRVELALAVERLEELRDAVERGTVRDDALVETLARMDVRSRAGAEALVRVAERSGEPELLDEVLTFTEQQATGIADVFDDLPVTVRPHAEDSIGVLRSIRDDLLRPLLGDQELAAAQVAGLDALLRSAPLPPSPAPAPTPDPTPVDVGDVPTPQAPPTEGTTEPALPSPDVPRSGSGDAGSEDSRSIVPRLPGPLDDVGRTVDDTVGGVLDGTGRLLEGAGESVGGALEGTGETVDGLLDGAGNLVDGTLGGVGGLLGGGSRG